MNEEPKRFTREQIKQITFKISSLDAKQRELVRAMLFTMHDQHAGLFYQRDLHLELMRMQQAYEISEIDRHNVEAALFPV